MSRFAVANISDENLFQVTREIAKAWKNKCELFPIIDSDDEVVVAYATSAQNGILLCSALEDQEQDEPIQTVAAGERNQKEDE